MERNDTNRVLLQFPDLNAIPVEKAELLLDAALSEMPPRFPFKMAVHAVNEAWEERDASWLRQPPHEEAPVTVVSVTPAPGGLRVDITGLVAAWSDGSRPNHGLLLKVAEPLAS